MSRDLKRSARWTGGRKCCVQYVLVFYIVRHQHSVKRCIESAYLKHLSVPKMHRGRTALCVYYLDAFTRQF
jgi:hypothetical protein